MISKVSIARALLVFLLTSLSFYTSSAQFSFAAQAGVNVSNVTPSLDQLESRYSSILTPALGALGRFTFGKSSAWVIHQRLLFEQRGTEFGFTENTDPLRFRYTYLSSQTTIGYRPVEHLLIEAGPTISQLFAAKQISNGDFETDIKENVNHFDIGLLVGASVEFGSLYFSLQYLRGLKEIDSFNYTDRETRERSENKIFNSTVQLSVGYFFLK